MASKTSNTAKAAPSSILEAYGAMEYASSRLSLLLDFLTAGDVLGDGLNLSSAGVRGLADILQDMDERLVQAMADATPEYRKALAAVPLAPSMATAD